MQKSADGRIKRSFRKWLEGTHAPQYLIRLRNIAATMVCLGATVS